MPQYWDSTCVFRLPGRPKPKQSNKRGTSASVTAAGSGRQTEMEAELAWSPTWLRAVGTPPVSVPPWLPSPLPALRDAPFPVTLGTQAAGKHQKETRDKTSQLFNASSLWQELFLIFQHHRNNRFKLSYTKNTAHLNHFLHNKCLGV